MTDQAEAGTEEIDPMEYYRQCVQWSKQLEVPVDWDSGEIGFAAIELPKEDPEDSDDSDDEPRVIQLFPVLNAITEPVADEILANPEKMRKCAKKWPKEVVEEFCLRMRMTIPELIPEEAVIPPDNDDPEQVDIIRGDLEVNTSELDSAVKKRQMRDLLKRSCKEFEAKMRDDPPETRRKIAKIIRDSISTHTEDEGIRKLNAMLRGEPPEPVETEEQHANHEPWVYVRGHHRRLGSPRDGWTDQSIRFQRRALSEKCLPQV